MPDSVLVKLALLLLIPATIFAFTWWRPAIATAIILLGATLFLPEIAVIDLPLFPALGKCRLATLCCLIAQVVVAKREYRGAKVLRGNDWIILVSIPIAQIGTVLTNLDTLAFGNVIVPGMDPKQLFGVILENVLDYTGPFLLGRMVYQRKQDAIDLLKILAGFGVAYVIPIAIELKSGPVCHPWLYGYLQHSFEQTIRGDGFRPMVFMAHGLAMALLMFIATMSSVVLARSSQAKVLGIPTILIAVGLTALFPALKSSAALTYTLLGLVVLLVMKPRAQLNVAVGIGYLTWLVMAIRIIKWPPPDAIVSRIARFSQERAGSLAFRFYNEDFLTQRALERPIFGWGGWGRNMVYDSFGQGTTTTDGAWIILFGSGGFTLLCLIFGLLSGPAVVARRRLSAIDPSSQRALAGLSIIVALCNIDLLPNGMFNSLQFFLAGSVAGLAWGLPEEKGKPWLPMLVAWYQLRKSRIRTTR